MIILDYKDVLFDEGNIFSDIKIAKHDLHVGGTALYRLAICMDITAGTVVPIICVVATRDT